MALVLPWRDKLARPISSTDTVIDLSGAVTALISELSSPAHIVATIYTAAKSETVMIYASDDTSLVVQRGFGGTERNRFPAGACLRVDEVIPGEVCIDDADGDDEASKCADIWSSLTVCDGLELNLDDPRAPKLCLKPTGVSVADMCGAAVNTYGQFTHIPANWPRNCITVYNPCADGDGGGAGGNAEDIAYEAPAGSSYITGDNLQDVLDNLDTVLSSLPATTTGVGAVNVDSTLSKTGPSTSPTLGLSSVIVPGVHDGFTIDTYGRVTGYSAPTPTVTSMSGNGAITAGYTVGTGYYVSVATSTSSDPGVVTLADVASTNINPGDSKVVTTSFLNTWWATAPVAVVADATSTIIVSGAWPTRALGVATGTISQYGCVILADHVPITAALPNGGQQPGDVVTVAFLDAWAAAKGL
jgi:hypothetical protein